MANVAELAIRIVTDAKAAQAGLDNTAKSAGKMKRGIGVASKVAAGAMLAVGAAAIAAGKAAAEDAQGQAILANQLRKTAGATDAQIASTEEWISKTAAATGVADDQLRPALASLAQATGDVTKSQDAMAVALDVAAATGKPVEAVAKAMAKGFSGSTGALGKLVPGLDKAALKAGDMTAIMDQLAQKTGGTAARAADTAAGKMQRATLAMDEAKEAAGAALLPVMGALAGVLADVGTWAQNNSQAVVVLAVAVGTLAGAVMVINAALRVYQATLVVVQAVQKATWLGNPIFLVIAAVVLLVAAVVLLWRRSETFRRVVLAMWAAIRAGAAATAGFVVAAWAKIMAAVSRVIGWIKANWKTLLILLTGPLGVAVALVIRNWDKIKTAVGAVMTWASAQVRGFISDVRQGFSAMTSIVTAPFDALHAAIQRVLDLAGSLIDKISKIKLPHVPGLGSFTTASPALGFAPAPAVAGLGRAGAATPKSLGAGAVQVNLYGVIDAADAARRIRLLLREDSRRRVGVRVAGIPVSDVSGF